METDFLEKTLSCRKMINFSPAASVEWKSAVSLSEAGMADCRVQRTSENGLNGKESNSDKQITRSCTHCPSSHIRLELHSARFNLHALLFAEQL